MLGKLAVRNVRRSVRDYAIYFVTLVLGVAAFYAFNSIGSQDILFDLEGAASEKVFSTTGNFLSMFSVVIAAVLGFLVVYANRFLITRRKQEFGTYLMLGMRPGQVSAIVLVETVLVGVASLVVGLGLGVVLSQALSFLTAGLFGVTMTQYQFVFSAEACRQTLLYFALIFVVVALFNTLTLRRQKLIDLLSARARNERCRVRSPWVSAVAFVVAVALLAVAYGTIITEGLLEFDASFMRATVLMLVGTFLFFWSVAGFVLAVIERTRGVYFRGLTMFTMRQIASKVNTAFLSLSVVCVMLFFSLTVFSTGAGMVQVFSASAEEGTHYDASVQAAVYLGTAPTDEEVEDLRAEDPQAAASFVELRQAAHDEMVAAAEPWEWDLAACLASAAPAWDDFVDRAVQADLYQPHENTTTYAEVMDGFNVNLSSDMQNEGVREQNVGVMGQSQFNALRELCGRERIDVGAAGFAVNNAVDMTADLANALATEGLEVMVGGHALTSTGQKYVQGTMTTSFVSDAATLIVPDWVIDSLRAQGELPYQSVLDVMYSVPRDEGDRLLAEAVAQVAPPTVEGGSYSSSPWPVTGVMMATDALLESAGMRVMITYLALYIGFVFLITTAAMLAIQQLSETSDSLPRYRLLAQLGCDRRMVLGSLRTQVCLYFLAPLGLAAAHTVCAVGVISNELLTQLGVSVTGPALAAVALTVVVYGSYLLVTYFASRGIVRASLGKKLLG